MSIFKTLALASVTWLAAGSTAFADVQLTIRNGQVSLVAKDATVRQILTEWARVGQTKIVNVERSPGGPITLELKDVPEQEALKRRADVGARIATLEDDWLWVQAEMDQEMDRALRQ